eukprot:5644985-Pyramimonas_sp.AAC.1
MAWNAQDFFAADPVRRETEGRCFRPPLARGDAALISEARGCTGQHSAWRPPRGRCFWWSAGPSAAS